MAGRTITPVTQRLVTSQSQMRSDSTLLPTAVAKFTVIHKRPIISLAKHKTTNPHPNTMCLFSNHPVKVAPPAVTPISKIKVPMKPSPTLRKQTKKTRPTRLKRSLSMDDISQFQAPLPAPKRPFPGHIWNSREKQPKLPVATCYWQDSPLHDSVRFVCMKLLEAAQAYRYLQLQGRARKYLHLTGGGIVAVNNPPARKPEVVLPPMTVKTRPQEIRETKRPMLPNRDVQLPPPPPLISLRPPVRLHAIQDVQDKPLELCKKRRTSSEDRAVAPIIKIEKESIPELGKSVTPMVRRKIQLPLIPIVQLHEPLDLATPSPTTALKKMNLDDKSSPISPLFSDDFRQRLVLVLQVLLGEKRLRNLGHPQVHIDEVLCRILNRAGVDSSQNGNVRENWMRFLRLCVKNEDAWKQEGWDSKSADAILNEIYEQDVIPVLRKSEKINGRQHSLEEKA